MSHNIIGPMLALPRSTFRHSFRFRSDPNIHQSWPPPTRSPIKGSSASVSTIRSAIVVRRRFFGIFGRCFLAGFERLRDNRRLGTNGSNPTLSSEESSELGPRPCRIRHVFEGVVMLPSPDGTSGRGRDAPVKELKVINGRVGAAISGVPRRYRDSP
jgi:hypothetical protein